MRIIANGKLLALQNNFWILFLILNVKILDQHMVGLTIKNVQIVVLNNHKKVALLYLNACGKMVNVLEKPQKNTKTFQIVHN